MKDISKLRVRITAKLEEEILPNLINAHRKTVEKIWEDIIDSAPIKTGNYISSIEISDTKYENGCISTEIYTTLKVGGDNPKWENVLLAHFINWGTGPLGESTNFYPHEYPYTTDKPWNEETWIQYRMTGTWGMRANPHFYLSLQKNTDNYLKNLKEAVKNARNNSK